MTDTTIRIDSYPTQLPIADLVNQIGVTIWQDDQTVQEDTRRSVEEMATGDRMMLAIRLAAEAGLPPTCSIVAAALAYRGWVSWPSQDGLGRAIGVARPHVSRALSHLAKSGLIRRVTLRRGRRRAATLVTWVGTKLVPSPYQIGTSWEPEGEPGGDGPVLSSSKPEEENNEEPDPSSYQIGTIPDEGPYQIGTIPDTAETQARESIGARADLFLRGLPERLSDAGVEYLVRRYWQRWRAYDGTGGVKGGWQGGPETAVSYYTGPGRQDKFREDLRRRIVESGDVPPSSEEEIAAEREQALCRTCGDWTAAYGPLQYPLRETWGPLTGRLELQRPCLDCAIQS